MKILFVAMSSSVHAARWIDQLRGLGWSIHLFASIDVAPVHPLLKDITVYRSIYARQNDLDPSVRLKGLPLIMPLIPEKIQHQFASAVGRGVNTYLLNRRVKQLNKVIRQVKPDIIHALEFQHAGYLTLQAKQEFQGQFPTLVVTDYGSDTYLFRHLAGHVEKIKALLAACDYCFCECERDMQDCIELGLQEDKALRPAFPNGGGFDLDAIAPLRQPGPASSRRLILLKGYQHFAGRALVGLRAIELCADLLHDYRVAVYSATPDVAIAAEFMAHRTGISIDVVPPCSHEDLLRLYGKARIYLGLSISDAISTSLLEAIVSGAFPIQSCTSCANEWIIDSETGFTVPPEDPQIIADALRRALTDDTLVDQAAVRNAELSRERLDYRLIQEKTIALYKRIAESK